MDSLTALEAISLKLRCPLGWAAPGGSKGESLLVFPRFWWLQKSLAAAALLQSLHLSLHGLLLVCLSPSYRYISQMGLGPALNPG